MGTHPIFESDFDCLTDTVSSVIKMGLVHLFCICLSVCGAQEISADANSKSSDPNPISETNYEAEQVPMMDLLVTGGAGFIGSHTVVELLEAGHTVTVIDDCSNTAPPAYKGGMPPSLERVKQIVGPVHSARLSFHLGDVTKRSDLLKAFGLGKDAVIHFAGLKAVGESKEKPLSYYRVNQGGTVNILEVMKEVDCNKIVFSSSATVYQPAETLSELPLDESRPTGKTTNPYARSKLHVEEILQDTVIANNTISVVNLRYFNPVGAHHSGLIGEDPRGIPNNVMPYISQVAIGRRPQLNVFGNDYESPDGTGMRDYIHVVDLAKGHLAALKRLNRPGFEVYNLGTGTATTVLELVEAFKKASGVDVPYEFVDRRPGDVAWLWCSPTKAKEELGWVATRNITDMCRDMWKFQSLNPSGYSTTEMTDKSEKKEIEIENTSDEETSDSRSDSGLSSNLDQSENDVSDQSESIESSPSSSPVTPRRPTLFSRFVHLSDPRDQFGLKSASTSLPDKTREL